MVGENKCAIVDTYWQTETGGHVLTPLPGATPTKPGALEMTVTVGIFECVIAGSATLPFFGALPCLLDASGNEIEGPGEGALCFKCAWPGMMRTVYGDPARFARIYFEAFKGYYFTGDGRARIALFVCKMLHLPGARRDDDGYYWVTGRVDDLMNVSGHLLSTAEIESALVRR